MSVKHLTKGAELPPLTDGKLRIYSMAFCPFAQRTRLVLAHKNIPHETVNVNLKSKPDWFLERNPLGLVPILEKDGKVLYESAICNEYLDEVYPEKRLLPQDPYEKARQKIIMDKIGKVIDAFYKATLGNGTDEKLKAVEVMYGGLDFFENSLKLDFFGGEKVGMTDLHIWPWFERSEANQDALKKLVPEDRFPKLVAWVKRMKETPAVKATIIEPKVHQAFVKSHLSGNINYDILIDGTV